MRSVRFLRGQKGGRVSFVLSERSTVTITTTRHGRHAHRVRVTGRGGRNVVRLPGILKKGRYRLAVTAVDLAGNRSAVARLRFTVVR